MLGKEQNVSALIESFFDQLLIRVIRVIFISKDENDRKIADCISENLKSTEPFGQTPKLVHEIINRAFPPVRMLRNALFIGHEFLTNVEKKVWLIIVIVHYYYDFLVVFCDLLFFYKQ